MNIPMFKTGDKILVVSMAVPRCKSKMNDQRGTLKKNSRLNKREEKDWDV